MSSPAAPHLPAPPAAESPPARVRRRRISESGSSMQARGEPMLWLTGGGLVICMAMIVALLVLVLVQGVRTLWPQPVVRIATVDGRAIAGEVTRTESYRPADAVFEALPAEVREAARQSVRSRGGWSERRLVRVGNFELTGEHFNWVSDFEIAAGGESEPEWMLIFERLAWGRFYGEPLALLVDGKPVAEEPAAVWEEFRRLHPEVRDRWATRRELETDEIGVVNRRLEQARLDLRSVALAEGEDSAAWQTEKARHDEVQAWGESEFARLRSEIDALNEANARYQIRLRTASGQEAEIALADVVRAYPPNRLGLGEKLGIYLSRWGEFLTDSPREANSEGGVFPAIFGTVAMTLLMSLVVVPFGVLAALYLREYAKAGPVVSAVRIAINNLAGVPSIVFGVFGLGFFCYMVGKYVDGGPANAGFPILPSGSWLALLGGTVAVGVTAGGLVAAGVRKPGTADARWKRVLRRAAAALWLGSGIGAVLLVACTPFFDGFYEAALPSPTFGKGAILWASLTLALLTLPVVIVATEEALAAVPSSMREGSYACGASKWQTIRRIVLPRAMPGIMTGTILAMARGAGEVAPLMLVGAVKLAPELPFDGTFPFVHPERSFMHLGFHIYDLGFQSQNSEAAKPMVFTTTLLLIAIVALLNLAAIWLRARLRRKFVAAQF